MTDDIKKDDIFAAPRRTPVQPECEGLFDEPKKPRKPFKLPKAVQWLFGIIGGVFVLLILAGLALPFIVDFNALRTKAIEEVRNQTGFIVALDEKIDVVFQPFPQATIYNVSVRHPSDAPDAPLLAAKEVTVGIGVAGLMAGRIDIPKLELHEGAINLRTWGEDKNNWTPVKTASRAGAPLAQRDTLDAVMRPADDMAIAVSDGAAQTPEDLPSDESVAAAPPPAFSIDTIALENTRIAYDPANGERNDVFVEDGRINLSGLDGPFDITIKGKAFNDRMPIDLDVELGELKQSGEPQPVPLKLAFKTDAGKVDLDGEATLGGTPHYAGKADVDFNDLPQFMAALNPKNAAPPAKVLKLNGDVVASTNAVTIKGGQVQIDEAKGPLDLKLEGLGSDALTGNVATKLQTNGWAMAKGFKEIAAQGRFSQSGGVTKLDPLDVTLDGQSIKGAVALGDTTQVALQSSRLDLTPILNALEVKDMPDLVLTGTSVDAVMAGQKLTVNSLTIDDVRGMKLSGKGSIADLAKGEGVSANVTVSSQNVLESLKQLPDVTVPKEAEEFLNGPGGATAVYAGTFDAGNLDARLNAMGGSAGVKTSVKNIMTKPATGAMTLVANHPNTNALLAMLAPGTKLGSAFNGAMSIEAGVAQDGNTWNVSNLKSKLGGTSVNGNLKITTGEIASVSGNLTTGAIDLEKWFSAKETKTSAREDTSSPLLIKAQVAGSSGKWSTAPIDVTWMRKIGLDLAIKAASLKSGPWTIDNPTLNVNLSGGALKLTDVAGGFFGGSIKANADVSSDANGSLAAKGSLNADNLNLDLLTKALVKTNQVIAGRGDLDLSVNANGASSNALINSMNGSGTLKGSSLVVHGLNIQSLVKAFTDAEDDNWASALGLGASGLRSGTTPFDDTTINLTIANGVATWPDTVLKNPSAEIVTQGRLDFPAWVVNIKNDVNVITHERRMDDVVVITTTGSLDNPQTKTNSQGISDKVKSRASDLIDKHAPEKYKGIINNILGTGDVSPAATTTAPVETAPSAVEAAPAAQMAPVVEEQPAATPAPEPESTSSVPEEPSPATPAVAPAPAPAVAEPESVQPSPEEQVINGVLDAIQNAQ